LIGRLTGDIGEIPKNVVYWGWLDDITKALSRTKILVVPTRDSEAFGRLPIEAGFCRIPSIASDKGGLKESVGDGGILIEDIDSIDLWVKHIDLLVNNDRVYRSFSEKAYQNAVLFYKNDSYSRFRQIVKDKLSIDL